MYALWIKVKIWKNVTIHIRKSAAFEGLRAASPSNSIQPPNMANDYFRKHTDDSTKIKQ